MEEFIAEMVRSQVAEAKGPAPAGITRCDCGVAAVRLVTKECGPTQCRYFWKCAGRVCQFFDWDQDEVGKVESDKRKEMMDQARYIEELQEQLKQNQAQYEQGCKPREHSSRWHYSSMRRGTWRWGTQLWEPRPGQGGLEPPKGVALDSPLLRKRWRLCS